MATYAQTWGVASSFERVDENSDDRQDASEPDLQIGQEGGGIGEGGLCSQGNNYGSPEDAEHIVVSSEVSGSRGVQRGEGGRASSLQRPHTPLSRFRGGASVGDCLTQVCWMRVRYSIDCEDTTCADQICGAPGETDDWGSTEIEVWALEASACDSSVWESQRRLYAQRLFDAHSIANTVFLTNGTTISGTDPQWLANCTEVDVACTTQQFRTAQVRPRQAAAALPNDSA